MERNGTYQLNWAWSLTKGHRKLLLLYFLLELAAIAFSLSFIYFSKNAVDAAIAQEGAIVKKMLALTVAAVLMGIAIRTYSSWLNERVRIRMLVTLQNKLIRIQMRSLWQYQRKWKTGDIQVRVQNDCQEIVQMLGNAAINALLTAVRLLASFGFLWLMDPMLAWVILAISPLFLFSKIYVKVLRKLNLQLKTADSNFSQVLLENLRLRNSIRALDLFDSRWQKVEDSQANITGLKNRLLNFSVGSQTLMKLTLNTGFMVTFIWGVYRLYTAEISFGTMTAFLQLVGRIQSPILLLMGFVPQFIRFRTAVTRVLESMETPMEQEQEQQLLPHVTQLKIENLSFKYEDSFIIDGFSATFERGKPVAILGASGKGKTTLIRLLLALMQPQSGNINLLSRGEQVAMSPAYRCNIAYVPQGDKLFSGTIRENILAGASGIANASITAAIDLACADFIHQLPEELDTLIGESGYGLSEGQAQRVAIVRAMLRESQIWLFDEITSALDKETGALLMDKLLKAGKDKIIVFVTHDKELAAKCHKVRYIE